MEKPREMRSKETEPRSWECVSVTADIAWHLGSSLFALHKDRVGLNRYTTGGIYLSIYLSIYMYRRKGESVKRGSKHTGK